MGALRIYKEESPTRYGYAFPWQVRSNGCFVFDPHECYYGKDHDGVCNGYALYEHIIEAINDSATYMLGAYLTK